MSYTSGFMDGIIYSFLALCAIYFIIKMYTTTYGGDHW